MVATLDDLDEDALVEILTKPKNALVKQYQRLFEMEDVKLAFTEEALTVDRARGRSRARPARAACARSWRRSCSTPMFELPGLDGVEEVVINREVVEARAKPLYIYGKERAESERLSAGAGIGLAAAHDVTTLRVGRAADILLDAGRADRRPWAQAH